MASVPRKWAILIGAKEYDDPAFRPLEFCAEDMKSLREILVQPDRGGYDEARALLLIDGGGRDFLPRRSNIMSRVAAVARSTEPEDTVLFAFSGHGMEENGSSYLLPADARTGVLADTAISVKWIKDTLHQASGRARIMILDACHAGAMIGKANSGQMTEKFSDDIFDLSEGFAALSSCKLNESSYDWEENRHGVFSYFMCEGLRGYADMDADGRITVSEASKYVTLKVKEWAFKRNLQQSPNLEYRVSGDIILTHVPGSFKPTSHIVAVGMEEAYVTSIALLHQDSSGGPWFDPDSPISEMARMLCAKLLAFYKPNEIKPGEQTGSDSQSYEFPHGNINWWQGEDGVALLELTIDYDTTRKNETAALVRTLCSGFAWDFLEYRSAKKLDMNKLVALCQKADMTVQSYDPKGDSPIAVSAPGWGVAGRPATVYFRNSLVGSAIKIVQSYAGKKHLEADFYEKLNPKAIVEFVRSAFV